MAGPIPDPVVAFTSGIVHFQEYIENYQDRALEWLGLMDEPNAEWRRLSFHYEWVGSTDAHDDMYFNLDLVNITGGAVDSSWTTSDYTTCEAALTTFATSIAAIQSSTARLKEWRWYIASYNPYTEAKPFAPHGPPERVTAVSIAGTGNTTPLAPQSAVSVTLLNPFPRNWGRFYIPAIGNTAVNIGIGPARLANAQCDAVATATQTLITNLASHQFQVVTPITQLGVGARGSAGAGTANRRLAQVTGIQVDNVLDVIRRRRLHAVTYRKKLP
jgi:hypothetical protein